MPKAPKKNNLLKMRNRRGLSLRQVAAKTGIGLTTVFRIESYHVVPKLSTAAKLAKLFRVEIDELFPIARIRRAA